MYVEMKTSRRKMLVQMVVSLFITRFTAITGLCIQKEGRYKYTRCRGITHPRSVSFH